MANNTIDLKFITDDSQLDKSLKKSQRLEREIRNLAKAESQGKITTEQYSNSVSRMASELQRTSGGMIQARNSVNAYSRSVRDAVQSNQAMSASAEQVGRRMSRSGVMVQQAGYQVGDFIVQVQSGTNPFVAFGQQATQMAGTLTLLGGKMVAIGTVLGIAIPLVTAFAAAWSRTRKDVDETSDSLKDLENNLESLDGKLEDFLKNKKAAALGISAEELLGIEGLEEAKKNLKEAEDALQERLDKARQIVVSGNPFKSAGAMLLAGDFFSEPIENLEARVEEARKRLKDLEVKEAEERSAAAAEFEAERKADQQDYLNGLMQESNFWATMYGKNQEQIEELNELREVHNDLLELGLEPSDKLYQDAVKYAQQARQNEEATQAMSDAIKEAAESYQTLLTQSSDLDTEIAKVEAQIKAVKTGSDVATAAYIAGERAKITATMETTKALALQTNNLILLAETAIAYTEAMDKLDNLESLKVELSNLKGGGGGKGEEKDPLAKLRERIRLDTELLDKSKERQEVERAIANSTVQYSQQAIDAAVAELEAYNQLVEKRQELQGLYDTAQSSFEEGFMSMVEGTKSVEDAFKDMARSIIKELYNVLVVQKMVGSFNVNTGSGSGILGFLGGFLGKRASGGTVMPNQPYLVGEKGPELIMPQNRGHVMNADLTSKAMSGGESITVVQNFSFQANGDESVKRIIAQAAPSIANMAKQSVMDARRRGGAMKNTFG